MWIVEHMTENKQIECRSYRQALWRLQSMVPNAEGFIPWRIMWVEGAQP